MNWGKLLSQALVTGVSINSVSDIDTWIDDKIYDLTRGRTNPALVEIALEVSNMDNDQWQYLIAHLKVKSLRNGNVDYIYQYCNYVVSIENSLIKDLLEMSIVDANTLIGRELSSFEIYEVTALYGILKSYSNRSMKAKALFTNLNNLLDNK